MNLCPPHLPGWEWSYLRRLCHLENLSIASTPSGENASQTAAGRGLAFSPDGRRVASADSAHRIKVWDTIQGDLVLTMAGHTASLNALVFSPDNRIIASASRDTTIRLWDAANGALIRALNRGVHGCKRCRSAQMVPDLSRRLEGSSSTQSDTARSSSGTLPKGARSVAFRATRSYPGSRIPPRRQADCLGRLWLEPEALGSGNRALQQELRGHEENPECVAYSPNGRLIATGGGDQLALIWDSATGALLHTLRGHDGSVLGVSFSPDNRTLASADGEGGIRIWDAARGFEIARVRDSGSVKGIAYSPNGRFLATAVSDNAIRLWETAALTHVEHRVLGHHRGWSFRAAYTSDGRIVDDRMGPGPALRRGYRASDPRVRDRRVRRRDWTIDPARRQGDRHGKERRDVVELWDAATGQKLFTFNDHRGVVKCATFSPDGKTIASAGATASFGSGIRATAT